MTTSFTYGPVDFLQTEIRYTTLADCKNALGINDAYYDAECTQAIVAFEVMMDVHMNRSLPDTGDNPEIAGIPEQVKQAALLGGVEIFKLRDGVNEQGGDDSGFIGVFDPGSAARNAFNLVRPMLKGLRADDAWGISSG